MIDQFEDVVRIAERIVVHVGRQETETDTGTAVVVRDDGPAAGWEIVRNEVSELKQHRIAVGEYEREERRLARCVGGDGEILNR